MTNYDVLMNSTEEECCKLLEEWKQSGIKAFDWLGANLAPGFTGFKDKNGKKIYEPACGTGNFLAEILERKFKLCQSWEDGLRALKSIYGMDIQADNVEEAKGRLFDMYIKQYPKSPAVSGLIAAQILENNIVCGDFIKEYKDERSGRSRSRSKKTRNVIR